MGTDTKKYDGTAQSGVEISRWSNNVAQWIPVEYPTHIEGIYCRARSMLALVLGESVKEIPAGASVTKEADGTFSVSMPF